MYALDVVVLLMYALDVVVDAAVGADVAGKDNCRAISFSLSFRNVILPTKN